MSRRCSTTRRRCSTSRTNTPYTQAQRARWTFLSESSMSSASPFKIQEPKEPSDRCSRCTCIFGASFVARRCNTRTIARGRMAVGILCTCARVPRAPRSSATKARRRGDEISSPPTWARRTRREQLRERSRVRWRPTSGDGAADAGTCVAPVRTMTSMTNHSAMTASLLSALTTIVALSIPMIGCSASLQPGIS